MKKIIHTVARAPVAAAIALLLCVAPPASASEPARSFVDMVKDVPLVPAGAPDSEMLAKVSVAVGFIKRLELPAAHVAINEALQLDPRNSHLHFLNGFVYHLQARQGDTQKGELALEGYEQALRIDPGNWIAREFMGLALMDLQQFNRARLAFSEVLQMTPDSAVAISGLMVASYLTGDAMTACAMAEQFQKTSASPDRAFLRAGIAVYASCGNFAAADRMRETFRQIHGDSPEVQRVDRRLAQWKAVYRQPPASGRPEELAQAFTLPGSASAPAARPAPVPGPASSPPVSREAPAAVVPAAPREDGPRMLLIDVVLLSTQELISTSKGVNLLSALTLQLGSPTAPAFSRVYSSTTSNSAAPAVSTAITRAVTVPALSYSLNIANANNAVNEVLARPTLSAIEGMPSEFFSGTNLSAGVVSTSQQGGTTVVPLDKRFGIKLAVTPVFLSQGRVQLKVDAQRTSLNSAADNPKVAYQIEIAEITANAHVVMNLGDTLVLSGLSEKASSSIRDGVPGLQDVPVLQYLFSNQKKNDIQRSVLILVTPRSPVQVSQAAADTEASMASRMAALREKFGFSSNSTPANVEAVMQQLQGNDFFREFRQGDVAMERWDRMRSTGDRLREALSFLFY